MGSRSLLLIAAVAVLLAAAAHATQREEASLASARRLLENVRDGAIASPTQLEAEIAQLSSMLDKVKKQAESSGAAAPQNKSASAAPAANKPPEGTEASSSEGGITRLNYSTRTGHTFIIHNVNTINGFGDKVEKKRKAKESFDNKSELDETKRQLKELLMSQDELQKQIAQEKASLEKSEKENVVSGVDPGKTPKNVTLTEASIELRRPWYNWGGDYSDAMVVVERGVCYLHGLLRGSGGMIGTLPEICRPKQGRLVFSVMKGGSPSRVDILNDGRIYHVAAGQSGWLALDGIAFALNIGPNIRLVNDWQPFGGAYREPSLWYKDGLCMASGLIRNGKWGHFVMLPDECTPLQRLVFSLNNHESILRADVLTAAMGAYIARAGGYARHGWVSLDGLAWTQNGGADLEINAPWHNYGGAYQPLRYERMGRVCYLSGLVTSKDWNNHITRLPEECRPPKRVVFGANVHMSSARVDVLPDGRVFYLNGKLDWDWLSLSGVKFVVKEPKKATAASPANPDGQMVNPNGSTSKVDAPQPKMDAPPSKPNGAVTYMNKKNKGIKDYQDATTKTF